MSWKLIKDFFFASYFFFAVIVCLYLSKNPLFKEFILLLNMYKLISNSYLILDFKNSCTKLDDTYILSLASIIRVYSYRTILLLCERHCMFRNVWIRPKYITCFFTAIMTYKVSKYWSFFLEKYLLCKMFKKYLQLTTLLASV